LFFSKKVLTKENNNDIIKTSREREKKKNE